MLQLLVGVFFFFFKKQSVNISSVSSEESSLDIDHAEEMELLLENYYMQVSSCTFLLWIWTVRVLFTFVCSLHKLDLLYI